MKEYPYTLKQIAQITGKSNTTLFNFIKENSEFIMEHSHKNGRFIRYDEEVYNAFITRFGTLAPQVDKVEVGADAPETPPEGEEISHEVDRAGDAHKSVIEAFEAQIEALKKERDELTAKLEARERDCAEWRTQAGQALSALSKEQARVERLEERLAGYLPAPKEQEERKLTLGERIGVLFGRTPRTK